MSCGVGRRRGWDLVLLWLWSRPAATAHIRPLAWEPPCAVDVVLKKKKKPKKKIKLWNHVCSVSSTHLRLAHTLSFWTSRACSILLKLKQMQVCLPTILLSWLCYLKHYFYFFSFYFFYYSWLTLFCLCCTGKWPSLTHTHTPTHTHTFFFSHFPPSCSITND